MSPNERLQVIGIAIVGALWLGALLRLALTPAYHPERGIRADMALLTTWVLCGQGAALARDRYLPITIWFWAFTLALLAIGYQGFLVARRLLRAYRSKQSSQ